jgi:ribosomal protein S18 acetylase RimI-like enzyme
VIRVIEAEDIPAIINLLSYLRVESPVYASTHLDTEYVSAALMQMHNSPLFIGYIDDEAKGFMFGMLSSQWFSPQINAHEQCLYVLPAYRGTILAARLIRAFERAAKASGAVYVYVAVSTGIQEKRTTALYEKLGYERCGGGLRKRI